jgi:phage tail-like protein
MPLPDLDSAVGASFGLEVDGIVIDRIDDVTGLTVEQDVIELKENTPDGKILIKRLPGRRKAGDVALTRALTDDQSFETWLRRSRFGMDDARSAGAIIFYDAQGTAFKRVKLENAWPKSVEVRTLEAGGTSRVTETLVLHHEGLEVE